MEETAISSKSDKPWLWKPGQSGNPSGRPKNTMKDYLRRKFMELSDEEKETFLKENKVAGVDQIKLAEGNPAQGIEHSGEITEKQYIIQRGTSNDQSLPTPQEPEGSNQEQP